MPYSNGPRKKSGKMVTMSAFIAEPRNSVLSSRKRFAQRFSRSTPFPSLRLCLLELLFCRERCVHLQQALGQLHRDLLPLHIDAVEIGFGERDFQQPGRSVAHEQQRRFARSEL